MKKINLVLLSGVCVLALSSCSWLSDWPPSGSKRAAAPAPASAPQATVMQTADATWIEPAAGDEAVATMVPAQTGNDKGLQDRINDLEQQMAQMRNDMSMMMPALTRLAEVQGDLQALLSSQIQPAAGDARGTVNNIYDRAPSTQNTPRSATTSPTSVIAPQSNAGMNAAAMAAQRKAAAETTEMAAADSGDDYGYDEGMDDFVETAPAATQQSSVQPVRATAGGKITSIRFGEHPDKTRIVMDISDEMGFDYDIDNSERILVLELGGDWSGVAQRSVSGSDMIAAYSASPDGQGGTRMAIQLKKPGQISWAQYIPPSEGKGHRVVIDVTGL